MTEDDRIPTRQVVVDIVFVIVLIGGCLGYVSLFAKPGPATPSRAREAMFEDGPGGAALLRMRQEALIGRYGWVDRATGVVRIPIDRAMRLIVAREAER